MNFLSNYELVRPDNIWTEFATTALRINSLSEWFVATCFVLIAYMSTYLLTSFFFEYTNPKAKTEERLNNIKKELYYGITAMVFNVLYATTYLYLIDHLTPFYGYYANRSYGLKDFAFNLVCYLFIMDSWFYWTHRLLHVRWFWRNVHWHHHQFTDPTSFAQDAVHPFEAVFQGPMGHHFVSLVAPMHPVAHSLFGFLTSVYAIAAHDGRVFDLNDHVKHHHFTQCNFGLYWGLWDYICGTRYSSKKFGKNQNNVSNAGIPSPAVASAAVSL